MGQHPPERPYVVFVFAGNAHQAAAWAASWLHPLQPWTYIEDPEMLTGLRGIHVVRVGSWQRRHDVQAIENALAERGAQFLNAEAP